MQRLRLSLKRCRCRPSPPLLVDRANNISQRRAVVRHRKFRSPVGGRLLSTTVDSVDRSITFGNVTVRDPPQGNSPNLIPKLPSGLLDASEVNASLPPCHLSHLRWMLQKDLILKQDFLLVGTEVSLLKYATSSPSSLTRIIENMKRLARERRHLLLLYAALTGREIEWISISKDTSEADLKQRKEVSVSGTLYADQAPVRAAINGRLLVLDGLEKAERNVLPTLNNLLENREMPLDDGSMLVSPRAYETHRMGISVRPDFRVAALASLNDGESAALDPPLRSRFQARLTSQVDSGDMLVSASARSRGCLSAEVLKDMVELACESPGEACLETIHDTVAYLEQTQTSPRIALNASGIGRLNEMVGEREVSSPLELIGRVRGGLPGFVETTTSKSLQYLMLAGFQSNKRAVALVGPKGCYKSSVARDLAFKLGEKCELFTLHRDLTARDLLMSRGTSDSGDTIWKETPLTRAAREGHYLILDGIDKCRADTLTSHLALLFEQGLLFLPDGTRLEAHSNFRCVAIAHPPSASDKTWIVPECKGMFHWVEASPLEADEQRDVLSTLFPSIKRKTLDKLLALQKELDDVSVDNVANKDLLTLTMRKLKHICRRVERYPSELGSLVCNSLMFSFLPDWERNVVSKCLSRCGIETSESISMNVGKIDLDNVGKLKRTPQNPLLVPNPTFQENAGQARVMNDILDAHSVGEKSLLISGYQGVGKNKIVDKLLSLLDCEREYLQLHRDTTVQSLLLTPSIEDGKLVYHDSPLLRAAKNGRILVLDEADKAPTEVVCLLKGLIEDGQLSLPDGRVLTYQDNSGKEFIQIHPDFCIWTLTNPAGYPFHGNDLAKEMSDVFSCHHVPPLDVESHKKILNSYGENVKSKTIDKIASIWDELRLAHESGALSYPFSVRESVAVVKHLNAFPKDGISEAIDNVVSFDRSNPTLFNQLSGIFRSHGIRILSEEQLRSDRLEGGISTPKTRASSPKHGKVDPDNKPHVGGNQWAGGTGGSDTAGLGGRGGPYRLDRGHPVHQVSEEMKQQVTEETKERARKMAAEALKKRLEDLDMGELDWQRYNSIRSQVDESINQLRSHLKDLEKRCEERVWLKNQSSGELDENKIVDALSGEKDIFKRRGTPYGSIRSPLLSDPIAIKFVVDISASMYRFNSYDQRLERLLEATCLIMEALRDDKRFKLSIVGHNGSSANIPLVTPERNLNEANQLRVLEGMVANTQYTYAGDNTIEAIELAVGDASKGELVIIISDANLKRYDISVDDLEPLQSPEVHAHLILIGSLGDEASQLTSKIPNERAQVCFHSKDLPLLIKKLVTKSLR